jgi:thiamine kinase-like enzyme
MTPTQIPAPFVTELLLRLQQARSHSPWPFAQTPWAQWVRQPLTLCEHWPALYAFAEQPAVFQGLFEHLEQSLPCLPVQLTGWSHGDLKPDNLLCDARGRLYLNDWHEHRPGDALWDLAKYTLYVSDEERLQMFRLYLSQQEEKDKQELTLRFKGYLASWTASHLLRYRDQQQWFQYQARLNWAERWLQSQAI